jgi:perosamine synthetase
VEDKGAVNLSNMIGFNFRMTEIEAAIGLEQLKKLNNLVSRRITIADRLTAGLGGMKGLRPPIVKKDCTHVYYVYSLLYSPEETGIPRDKVFKALVAEGVPITDRYVNIHLLPIYQKKMAYGTTGFPWSADFYRGQVSYEKGICPVAEILQDERFMAIRMIYAYTDDDLDLIIEAFHKVWDNLSLLG